MRVVWQTRTSVGYVPEGRRVFSSLTVEENLKVPLERTGQWDIDRVYRLFPRLAERRQSMGRQLSGGEQEMLAIGRALLLNPRLLLLDEPSQGLAPLVVRDVFKVISDARAYPSCWWSKTFVPLLKLPTGPI